MKLPDIIYLDTAFIIQTYVSVKGVEVPVRVVKKSGFSGGFSWIVNAGASMEETKEFPISSRKMYDELADHLDKVPTVNLDEKKDTELPELFWTDGIFASGHSSIRHGSEEIASANFFRFQTSIREDRRSMNLTACDTYFVSGYDQLSKYGYAFTAGFGIRARLLIRLLCIDEHYAIGAPMVIIKTNNSVEPTADLHSER